MFYKSIELTLIQNWGSGHSETQQETKYGITSNLVGEINNRIGI